MCARRWNIKQRQMLLQRGSDNQMPLPLTGRSSMYETSTYQENVNINKGVLFFSFLFLPSFLSFFLSFFLPSFLSFFCFFSFLFFSLITFFICKHMHMTHSFTILHHHIEFCEHVWSKAFPCYFFFFEKNVFLGGNSAHFYGEKIEKHFLYWESIYYTVLRPDVVLKDK